jgi:flagellar P-ring protein precursor FlgI
MYGRFRFLLLVILAFILFSPSIGEAARIKDIVSIKGIRPNQLFGYGLIIGLNGSGDKAGASFTIQGLANMLEHMGIHVSATNLKVRNVAAVVVSAMLPPFARIGQKIDITISSIGDAKSLQGGNLLLTPLKGVDGRGGVTKNHPTVGRISGGATVEREIPLSLKNKQELTIILNNPDFNTAFRIAGVINSRFGDDIAKPIDSGTLKFRIPREFHDRTVDLLAQIGKLEVVPDTMAKVIVNERTGTVVIGENVRISKVAVAHGNLSIEIKETKEVSQPLPFAPSGDGSALTETEEGVIVAPGGSTVVSPKSDVSVSEEKNRLLLVPEGRTIGELVRALNAIGVTPRDLITILQAIKAAGALQAELEII